jgi:hypothetical protein
MFSAQLATNGSKPGVQLLGIFFALGFDRCNHPCSPGFWLKTCAPEHNGVLTWTRVHSHCPLPSTHPTPRPRPLCGQRDHGLDPCSKHFILFPARDLSRVQDPGDRGLGPSSRVCKKTLGPGFWCGSGDTLTDSSRKTDRHTPPPLGQTRF